MAFSIKLLELHEAVMADMGVSKTDILLVRKRFTNEGISFLTKILPKFSKTVLAALESGKFPEKGVLTEFSRKAGLPRFLRGYLSQIFLRDGSLCSDPCPVALYAIRQVCEYFYKLALDFAPSQLIAAEEAFIKTEQQLSGEAYDTDFVKAVKKTVERDFTFAPYQDILAAFRPRNGPGTFSADRSDRDTAFYFHKSDRTNSCTIPSRFEGIAGYFKSYPGSPERITFRDSDTASMSELLFVPKDSRGPRTIIREPRYRLMVQMAYFDYLSVQLTRQTRGRVLFRDQQVHRGLARSGSRDGKWATLDLKEASDRVMVSVATTILGGTSLLPFLNTRSTHTRLPSGKVLTLRKLAGMGSGLTFATMALVIYAAISTEVSKRLGISTKRAGSFVYVYGDDVIVPTHWSGYAKDALTKVGLLVNTGKSFTSPDSRFRESCGGDYFHGCEVGPLRAKFTAGFNYSNGVITGDDSLIIQVNAHARELVKAGMHATASLYYRAMERVMGPLPTISGDSPVIGRYTPITPSYTPLGNGMYKKRSVFVPLPVRRTHPDPNPYRFIGPAITPSRSGLFEYGCATGYEVSIPRMNKLVRRRVSEFRLCG